VSELCLIQPKPKVLFCRHFDVIEPYLGALWSRRSRVRIPSLTLCDVSGDPGHVSRVIVDSLGLVDGLVVAVGVEGEFADELAVFEVDDADVLVGDQELDCSSFVGSADADVVEFAVVA
jgi:hypothetical protein